MPDLASRYNVLEKLGDGARSVVFKVVEPESGRVFALKRVVRDRHEDRRFLQQALTEHDVARQLDHPALRKVHQVYKLRRLFRLSEVQALMQYVEGVGLDRHRPQRIDRILDLFIRIAEGLDAMHARGFLHTDVKPNNLLLTPDGGVKIIDFGQSCPIGFRKSRIQGTPDYIAPEQVDRRHLSQQTDVFNLGATLYWTLTGRNYPTLISRRERPRRREGHTSAVPAPAGLNPDVPPGLSRLVMECCAFDRAMRPRDMREVIRQLATLREGLRDSQPSAPGAATEASADPPTPSPPGSQP